MKDQERKLSDYIDRLNAEMMPEEDENSASSPELRELYRTVKQIRSLRETAMPGPDFPQKLARSVASGQLTRRSPDRKRQWSWLIGMVSAAALLALLITFVIPLGRDNVVSAMEKAYMEVGAYHGTLEVVETAANGESDMQAKWDVWADQAGHYYVKGLEGANRDIVTVNNGQSKWQIQPDREQVQIFPTLPDAYRFQFELGNEIQQAKQAQSVKVVGEETISGRKASVVEVTPKGGLPYRIWVDEQTNLPLRKQTAMQHAIQYTYTYSQIDFADAIPQALISYRLPDGFAEINTNPEQIANDLDEAQEIAGFRPLESKTVPSGYVQDRLAVVPDQGMTRIYYRDPSRNHQVMSQQSRAAGEFKPDSNALLGRTDGSPVEILSPVANDSSVSSIRWRQDGYEFKVAGDASLDDLAAFAQGLMSAPLEMPAVNKQTAEPQVKVPYDLDVEKGDQRNADAGSSPWKLDPVFVAQVFVSLQMSPGGISGDYPIAMKDLEVSDNDGTKAIVTVNNEKAPSKRVYLAKLVRQDASGIWTVVGYDPR
ncbi:MAG: hypothetical protein K0R75_1312 [Paenibacillaceae bacterium]|nr:hypothetical protein [Paenibacillaceae bacterium]